MGNYKFRLSDMIPNAWFYKLKYMTRPRNNLNTNNNKTLINPTNNNQITSTSSSSSSSSSTAAPSNNIPPSTITSQSHSSSSDQRKSYYFTRDLTNLQPNNSPTTKTTRISVSDKIEPPRKSSRRRRSTKRMIISRRQPPSHQLVSSSLSAGCSCRATLESVWTKPPEDSTIEQNSSSEHESLLTEYGSDRGLTPDTTFDGMLSLAANSCKCRTHENDVVSKPDNERISDHLRPIITKKVQEPTKTRPKTSAELSERSAYGSLSVKLVKEDFLSSTTNNTVSPVRRSSPSPGVKLRTNSPRIANRRIQGRKTLASPNSSSGSVTAAAETFAVVKTSKDPRRDFRESMVEMIVENNLRASKDLEELLACYLSLNSDEYHDVIINVFKQIWFDFVHLRLK
ncbi:hypothetical protein ABFX02_10G005500 [Erythranthe guttata]